MKSARISTSQWLIGLVALFILNACVEVAAPQLIDACAVLTQADAEGILGQPVNAPEHPIDGSGQYIVTSCSYQSQDKAAHSQAVVIISIPHDGALDAAQLAFDQEKDAAQKNWNAAPVDIAGIGDRAIWIGGSGNYLAFLRDNAFVTLKADSYQGETPPQPLIDLAKTIVNRLPGVYRGVYVNEFEVMSFQACGNQELWWVKFAAKSSEQFAKQQDQLKKLWTGGAIYVSWRGWPSRQGDYGHMGDYERQFTVTEVLTVTNKQFENCD